MASQSVVRVFETPNAAREREERNATTPGHWVDAKGSAFRNPWPSWRDHDSSDNFYIIFQHQRRYPPIPSNISTLIPVRKPSWGFDALESQDKIRATWLGHACFLVEFPATSSMRGARVLFDPVFSERCSPSQWAGPKRFTPAPCSIEEIPPVDVIVISHNHYDHLDTSTIRTLFKRTPKPHIFAPLGNADYFASLGIPKSHVHILDWWDSRRVEVPISPDLNTESNGNSNVKATATIELTCTPAQHFTGRGVFDRFKTLWASWVVEQLEIPGPSNANSGSDDNLDDNASPNAHIPKPTNYKVFFAGDTGYRAVLEGQDIDTVPRCPAFKQIGDKFGSFDFAMIPIGAYLPQRFMSPIHCSPADSVLLFKDVKAKRALGMHWGAWILTLEEVTEPPKRLREECEKAGIEPGAFDTCEIGETVVI